MSVKGPKRCAIIPVMLLALIVGYAGSGVAQNVRKPTPHDVVNPPLCSNNSGETVLFLERNEGRSPVAAGMAVRDASGKPVVFRFNYAATPAEFQRFIDRHECAHHQTGDVDRPHPPRNSADHLMNESISDCIAILRLRDEEGFNRDGFNRVTAVMRSEMTKIGFPEISISSRIRNIDTCFSKYGPPQDFVRGILKQRGLPQE